MQLKDKEVPVTEDDFKANLAKNADGTGIMFANNGKVIVRKALKTVQEQVDLFNHYTKSVTNGAINELIIHSRLATHGLKNELNCHPYQVLDKEKDGDEVWCMHNGIITCKGSDLEKDKSDTYNFLNYYVRPLIKGKLHLLDDIQFIEMLSSFIGKGNKLVFLDHTGKSYFVNKDSGIIFKGKTWLSNSYSGINNYTVAKRETAKSYNYPARGYGYGSMYSHDDYDDYEGYEVKDTKPKDTKGWITNSNGQWIRETSLKPASNTTNVFDKTSNLKVVSGEVVNLNKEDKVMSEVARKVIDNMSKKKGLEKKDEDLEEKAVSHGVKLLIAAGKRMTQEELYLLVTQEPIIVTELLQELLNSTEIVVGV